MILVVVVLVGMGVGNSRNSSSCDGSNKSTEVMRRTVRCTLSGQNDAICAPHCASHSLSQSTQRIVSVNETRIVEFITRLLMLDEQKKSNLCDTVRRTVRRTVRCTFVSHTLHY